MKLPVALAALLFLSTAPAQIPEPKPPVKAAIAVLPSDSVDSLSDADLARILPLLKENYIGAEKITEKEIARSTVQGLIDRLGGGTAILQAPASNAPAEPSPFRSELVDERTGYLRIGSLTPANLSELDTALQNFSTKGVTAIVLDLRATPAGSEFEPAAEICKRFCPKGKVLFTLKKATAKEERLFTSRDEPRYKGLIAVLVDSATSGAPEVIAAVLRTHTKAMLIGQRTRGQAAEFAELPLPSGKLLRIAVGEIALPDNATVFPGGVKPDLTVEIPIETTNAVLKAGLEKGIRELVSEPERARLNEAALVAGNNPEIEAYQAAQRARNEKIKPPLRDVALQRALDFITTIGVYEKK
ncbi:MAG: Peptidase [Chthoniobacteraceae bacterium]|nr:Peptidase [Chthoniobacteraceae bacterium]